MPQPQPLPNNDSASFSTGISSQPEPEKAGPATGIPTAPVGDLKPVSFQDLATHLSLKYEVDPGIVARLIQTESNWNPKAISPKGARGLTQLMPGTAMQMGVNIDDPSENLEGGIKYLSQLLQKYGDYPKALAAYNAGPENVDRASGIPNFPETQDYVKKIMGDIPTAPVGQLRPVGQPSAAPSAAPASPAAPAPNSPFAESPTVRFLHSATEASSGLPGDIRDWPAAFHALTHSGIPVDKIPAYDPMRYAFEGANALGNVIKGIAEGSGSASQEGLDRMKQPGIGNKVAGAERYLLGGIPIWGPNLVKWADQLEKGDVAGSLGTLGGVGLQGLMSMPDATAAKLDGASQYLIAKPRVQETILATETQHMLESAEASARAQGHALYPDSKAIFTGSTVRSLASNAIANHMQGSPNLPKLLNDMTSDDMLGRALTMKDLQGYYTELNSYVSKGNIPGDIYATAVETRNGIGKMLERQYQSEGKGPEWEDANVYWKRLANTWWDKDSPLAQSLSKNDATSILKPLTGDQADRATKMLEDYRENGADPSSVKATAKFYKGLDAMQFRGLYRAAGPLLLATYMARAEGMPYGTSMGILAPIIMAKLFKGWVATRPSFTRLLSEVPPTTAGGAWIPRQSAFKPYTPGSSPFPGGSAGPAAGPGSPAGPVAPAAPPSPIGPAAPTSLDPFQQDLANSLRLPYQPPPNGTGLLSPSAEMQMFQENDPGSNVTVSPSSFTPRREPSKPADIVNDLANKTISRIATDDAPNATPDRRALIGRGAHGQVVVEFPDAMHKELFSAIGRSRAQLRGGPARPNPNFAGLAKQFGVPETGENGIYTFALKYRNQVLNAIKDRAEGSTYVAPRVGEKF